MIYWLFLIVTVFIAFKFQKNGEFFLWRGFYLFVIGAVMNVVKISGLAEIVLKISYILLLVGFTYSIKNIFLAEK